MSGDYRTSAAASWHRPSQGHGASGPSNIRRCGCVLPALPLLEGHAAHKAPNGAIASLHAISCGEAGSCLLHFKLHSIFDYTLSRMLPLWLHWIHVLYLRLPFKPCPARLHFAPCTPSSVILRAECHLFRYTLSRALHRFLHFPAAFTLFRSTLSCLLRFGLQLEPYARSMLIL